MANDACLYSEDYVSRLVEQRLEGDTREMVGRARPATGVCFMR